ncbi:Hypothetical predicted protein [Octopus vulgaris]|uniref:Uncharacterized protein n=1 Tax=Octopus vulgaris TaxID=6645 RepID=A0AA36B9C3_OCTVU|nr:Hypothetical predicted protein [Octopus vulgaris]
MITGFSTECKYLERKVGPKKHQMWCARLRWYGHVARMDEDSCVKKCHTLAVEGTCGIGRPRKTWNEVVKHELRTLGLTEAMTSNRDFWKYAVLEKTQQAK